MFNVYKLFSWIVLSFLLSYCDFVKCDTTNLTCYQCERNTNVECGEESLLPCPPVSDRCVTHIAKNAQNGFTLKRECGLGPCGFDDDAMNKGLGLDGCDRSRDEYFCIFCCRGNGCNKSVGSRLLVQQSFLLVFSVLSSTLFFYKYVTCQ
ncbi:uncharacterized protein LOC123296853 [Chrysoperla carnea]|uniref:uncharacterized protein LOC123296853 n=1 Tax=Chrysoperla carnea TaxID=189513 RepID=UPI001D05F758|nr:uncharacterized protein LOC123296853 [Chrysoperla carnea]